MMENNLQEQQEIALNYSLSQFERNTQGISNFNKKVLFAIKYIGRLAQKHNPSIYKSYLLHDAPIFFEKMFMNVSDETTKMIPFKTFMINVAPYIPKVMEKDEEFLFNNYKQVELLAKLPLCEFKNIGTPEKEQIWSKLHDLITFIDSFQSFCSNHFSQQMQVLTSSTSSFSPDTINKTLTSMDSINKDDMMSTMSQIQTKVLRDETKSKEMFDEFQKFVPKEIFEMGFGTQINSMTDLISLVQNGLQEINQADITQCMNELRGEFTSSSNQK